MLGYDLGGNHPLHPLRWELTWQLAGELGVLEHYQVLEPEPADDRVLAGIHTPDYIEAVRVYNTSLKTFPGILWAATFFRANKPMAEFTANDGAQTPPQVKF